MKRWSLVLAAMLVMVTAVNSLAVEIEVEGDAYVGVYNKYLWRGIDLSEGQPVLQGGMDFYVGGFSAGFWSNYQLNSGTTSPEYDRGEITETDILLSYTFDLTEKFAFTVGDNTYFYNVPGVDNEMYLGFAFDVVAAPEFNVYYAWGGLDSLFYTLGVSQGFEASDALSFGVGALASYSQKRMGYTGFHNYELIASFGYALTNNWSLSASVLFSDALSDDAETIAGVTEEFVGGLNITFAY